MQFSIEAHTVSVIAMEIYIYVSYTVDVILKGTLTVDGPSKLYCALVCLHIKTVVFDPCCTV